MSRRASSITVSRSKRGMTIKASGSAANALFRAISKGLADDDDDAAAGAVPPPAAPAAPDTTLGAVQAQEPNHRKPE